MKKLEILIPQYDEKEETIKPLLDSISIQQNIDFNDIGVIICNDGSEIKLSEEFLKNYDFAIKYIEQEHKGVSAARNKCLDSATAEYVMYCDADDMFFNACGLWIIFRELRNGGFDSMSSLFIEETRYPSTREVIYINRDMDVTFVHGKIHRRQFLIDNNIRWNDKLTIHEDSYFNILCKVMAGERYKYLPQAFYLWKWRDTSVCRHDEKYMLKTYNNMLESNTALIKELLKRGRLDQAQICVTTMIFDAYYTLNKDEWWQDENKDYKKNVEKRFKEYLTAFREVYESTPYDVKNQIIMSIKNRMYKEGLFLEKLTFSDWLNRITGKEGETE